MDDFNWLKQKKFCVCVCLKWLQKLRKKHEENVVLKHFIYLKKVEKINELCQKMSDVETQTKHSNIAEVVLRRIRKYYRK